MKSVVLMKNIDEDDGQRRIIVCYGAHLHALFLSIEEIRDCLKILVTSLHQI